MIFLWIIAGLMLIVFIWKFLIPYLRNKITLWYVAYKFRQIAKQHTGKLRDDFNDLAQRVKELADSEKL